MSLAEHFPHAHEPSHVVPTPRLWFPMLGGPIANIAAFLVNIFVVREACSTAANISRFVFVAIAIGVSVYGWSIARRNWSAVEDRVDPGMGGTTGRDRFLTVLGLGGSFLGIVLGIAWVPVLLMLNPCGTP